MKKYQIFLIVLTIIVVVAGLVLLKYHQAGRSDDALLNINSDIQMNETQSQLYEEIKKNFASDPDAYLFRLGRLKQDLGDYAGAIEIYEKIHENKPEDLLPLINTGSIYFDTGRYEEAEKIQLEIVSINYKWLNAYQELLMIYQYHLKDKKATLESLMLEAQKNSPELEKEFNVLFAKYYDDLMNDNAKAIEYYGKILEANPDDSGAKQRLAELKK